ncbi:MAG: mandelate racemase/muconate lactonizing enzyme family protein [Bryobacteraceae bacterium]
MSHHSRITAIDAIPVRLPRDLDAARGTAGTPNLLTGDGDYRWSADYPCLYPTHIETALVRVTLDSGLIGWGEAQAPLAPEVACAIVERLLRPAIVGEEFDGARETIERLWTRMYAAMRVRGQTGGFMLDAISGIDIALWDLAGKLADKPVAALLAENPKTRVPAYLSGVAGPTLHDKIHYAARYHDAGFHIFKIYLESDWNAILEQVDALHDRLSGDVEVAVDALWHVDPHDAPRLDNHGALWLECPLMPEEFQAHLDLARHMSTPLALGESYRTLRELEPFFDRRVMGWVQPDLGRCGITESMRIAARAADTGVKVVPHVSIAMGPQIAAAIHFAAAAPACDLCEYNPKVLDVANRFVDSPIALDGPSYIVPDRPGLGIEVRI